MPDPPQPSPAEEPDPPQPSPAEEPANAPPAEKYPSSFVQDEVGRAFSASAVEKPNEGEHLLATDKNMLSTEYDVRWRGGGGRGDKAGAAEDLEDPEEVLGDDPKSPWDDDSLGSYFTLMGFLFHLNTLRLDQQRLPVAIALLLATYMIVAIYVLYVMLGAMMIHISTKYDHLPCEQNLSQWTLVAGVYICVSFVMNLTHWIVKLLWQKQPLVVLQNIGGVFYFVWFIIGCVRVYKIDADDHVCPKFLWEVSYWYCTVILGLFMGFISMACCAAIGLHVRRDHPGGQ